MKHLFLDTNDKDTDLSEAIEILKKGGVIAYPTDTIYGLGCRIFSPEGVERIFKIKGRNENQPLSILVSDISEIEKYAICSEANKTILKRHLPGPYTFILKASPLLPKGVIGNSDSVGIRVPDSQVSLKLAESLGEAIVTTSVNRTGEYPLSAPDKITDIFSAEIDLLIDTGTIGREPSTIVDLTGEEAKVIRQGMGGFASGS